MATSAPDEVRVPQAEALLRELGLDFELRFVAFDEIDNAASLRNQARIEPLTEERVDRYAASRAAGAVFPATIVGRNGKKKLITADGNHRHAALRQSHDDGTWAYVFKYSSDGEFRGIADLANARLNGAENSLQERLMHAAHHVDNGVPLNKAGALFGVTAKQISAYQAAQKARARLHDLGIHARSYSDLSDSTLGVLSGAAVDDALRPALAAIRSGIKITDIKSALREASKEARSDRERTERQLAAIKELEESHSKASASVLVKGEQKKRDTTRMRLSGALQVIKEVIGTNNEDYIAILDEIRVALS